MSCKCWFCRSGRAAAVWLALLTAGCDPVPPAREVDATAAMRVVLEAWGERPARLPRVFIVEPDGCAPPDATGFTDPMTGRCIGGFERNREEIYLVAEETYSETNGLAHELLHVIGWDHVADDWTSGEPGGQRVEAGSRALRARPDLDRVPGVAR